MYEFPLRRHAPPFLHGLLRHGSGWLSLKRESLKQLNIIMLICDEFKYNIDSMSPNIVADNHKHNLIRLHDTLLSFDMDCLNMDLQLLASHLRRLLLIEKINKIIF